MPETITFTPKQVSEKVDVAFDFSLSLASGETIVSIDSVTATNLGEVAASSNVTISGEVISGSSVRALVAGGTDGERYLITAKVATSRPQILELEAYQPVRDRP